MAPVTVQEAPEAVAPPTIYRKDYKPTPFLVENVDLTFVLNEDVTQVRSKLSVVPNYSGSAVPELFLHGRKDVELVSVHVNGEQWDKSRYELTEKSLTLRSLPEGGFSLEIVTHIKPQENSLLEGLYKSSGNYCTQCEAEGFRGITFFLDRPDVMAKYTTRIEADKKLYPVLLSNGNLMDSGELEGGRHFTVWEDPFPKPCYLFALVAGDLAEFADSFVTKSGREVALRIYVQQKNINQVQYAMESLKRSMKWDEDTWGLEYDLDLFNIVAVDDFNMGAMENKSLNIFNSRLVLASPQTATDGDFQLIEGVVGHEYFHNWTGNRVTCRDWFQLTLKEGLTVFRDQEFTADVNSRPVKRISDVQRLRMSQFSQDSGPMAHPIRPDSYIKMDNFYTVTVYEKGAEVVRLFNTLLGRPGFRKGLDLYFKRHDGHAVTCDDFLAAMADANGADLEKLGRWYGQAGTPQLTVQTHYDAANKTFTIKTKQFTPPTKGQEQKVPVLIPLAVGLLGPDGSDMQLRLKGAAESSGTTAVLRCENEEDEFVFVDVEHEPVPSLLRDFSAPVKLEVVGQTDEHLLFQLAHDSDSFNRWDAGQRLALKLLIGLYDTAQDTSKGANVADRLAGVSVQGLVDAYRNILRDESIDAAFAAVAISLPSQTEMIDAIPQANPVLCHQVREHVVKQVASALKTELRAAVARNDSSPDETYSPDAASSARRALKNKCLAYLAASDDADIRSELLTRFRQATNMTDQMAAMAALVDTPCSERDTMVQEFYDKWRNEDLVMLKWIGMQAMSNVTNNIQRVRELIDHPVFKINNPNNCYSLFLRFAGSYVNFHAEDGSGYEFLADAVLRVDKINHQVAARIVSAFTTWEQYDEQRQQLIKKQLKRIVDTPELSENVFEIASKSL